jgi:hypothetical protein
VFSFFTLLCVTSTFIAGPQALRILTHMMAESQCWRDTHCSLVSHSKHTLENQRREKNSEK